MLPNVEFTVFTEDGKEVKKAVTNENGIAKVEGLTFGKYYFLETKHQMDISEIKLSILLKLKSTIKHLLLQ